MRIRPLTALPLALFAAFGIAGPAAASTTQQSLMQDDDLVLYRGPDVQASTLQRMAGLGVDTVRINLIWRNVVGKGGRKAQRKPTNPASYPAANWDPYDGAVRTAASLGMGVYVTVTGPAPDYAEGEKPPSRSEAPVWKPDPKAYGKFVQAVGRRYSGGYQDENDSAPLPAINQWSLWNEPNQAGWLEPQYEKRKPASVGVQLQFRPQGSADYTNSGPPIGVSDALGFYSGTVADPGPGTFRAVWSSTTEAPFSLTSREVNVSS